MAKAKQSNENPDSPGNEGNGNGNGKVQLDSRFLVKIEGRDFVTYPGLLDLGHQKGLESIEVEPIQLPNPENDHFAVCKAVVTSSRGETFTDIGDANPQNTSARVSKHLLRMASTRAIARALRTFTNIGMTCLEELDDGEVPSKRNSQSGHSPKTASGNRNSTTVKSQYHGDKSQVKNDLHRNPPAMSDSQRRAILAISRKQGLDESGINQVCGEMFNRNLDRLSVSEASSLITHLQKTQVTA